MSGLAELVRIRDPEFYLDDPYPVFAKLRSEAPAFYHPGLVVLSLVGRPLRGENRCRLPADVVALRSCEAVG